MIDDVMNKLKDIGVDVDNTMELLGSNTALYEKLLTKFINTNPNYQGIIDSFAENNIENAISYSHTLKSVAGNLGFTKMSQISTTILTRLRAGETTGFEDDLAALTEEYNKIKSVLSVYIS
ncbi:MAG: Hpt domain-containing protein [Oscillospiraceae bacterium]|nr:Hpt domain-containing protein [Oscillospiraceae bacterium]